jgi:hypothetical protein
MGAVSSVAIITVAGVYLLAERPKSKRGFKHGSPDASDLCFQCPLLLMEDYVVFPKIEHLF